MVLDKGLKFVPLKSLDKFQTYMDVHKFVRKLYIKRYLTVNPITSISNQSNSGYLHSGLANASLFNPPGVLAPSLNVFRDVILRDLESLKVNKARNSKIMQEGLDSLCQNKDLVIRLADGGGIVVLDKKDYMTEM